MKCPNCNREIPNEANFCLHCGTKIVKDSTIECPSCHHVIPSDSKFCPDCGTKLQVVEVLNVTPCCPNCGSNEVKDDGTGYLQFECNNCGKVWGDDIDDDGEALEDDDDEILEDKTDDMESPTFICPNCDSKNVYDDESNYLQYLCLDCGHRWGHDSRIECPKCGSNDVENDGTDYLQFECNKCGNLFGLVDADIDSRGNSLVKYFEVSGVVLGVSTENDVRALGGMKIKSEDKIVVYELPNKVSIYFFNDSIHINQVLIQRSAPVPEFLRSIGLNWEMDKEEFHSLFEKLGFKVKDEDKYRVEASKFSHYYEKFIRIECMFFCNDMTFIYLSTF